MATSISLHRRWGVVILAEVGLLTLLSLSLTTAEIRSGLTPDKIAEQIAPRFVRCDSVSGGNLVEWNRLQAKFVLDEQKLKDEQHVRRQRLFLWGTALALIILAAATIFLMILRQLVKMRTMALRSEIAERQQIEDALRKNEERLQNVLEILPVGVWIADKHGKITHGNPAGQQIWAGARYVGPAQFEEYKAWWVATGKPVKPDEWGIARAIARGERSSEEELEIECFDGTHKIILNWTIPIWGPDQTIEGAVAVNQDITERKQAEEKLQQSETLLKTQLENSPDLIMVLDRNYRYLSLNKILFGSATVDELIGQDAIQPLPPHVRELTRNKIEQCFITGVIQEFDHEVGEGEWAHARVVPLPSVGAISRVMIISTNITDRKRAEEQIKNQNVLLEQAVQQKQQEMEALFERLLRQEKLATIGQMAGSIAHELRNPLGAVKQSVFYLKRLAQRQELVVSNPKVLRHLDLMDAELNTAERVITDLFEMTRMKPPQRVQTDLHALLAETLAHSHLPERVRVIIALEQDPFVIYADPIHLRQVLLNVLTNAAQAIEGEGAITINGKQLTEPRASVIKIHDTGIGLAPEALNHLFEPLYTTKATGTGLGLSICKQIIESHHGQIGLTSKSGEGTTVTILLPRV